MLNTVTHKSRKRVRIWSALIVAGALAFCVSGARGVSAQALDKKRASEEAFKAYHRHSPIGGIFVTAHSSNESTMKSVR